MTRQPVPVLEFDELSEAEGGLSELEALPGDVDDGLVPPKISDDPEHDRLVDPEF